MGSDITTVKNPIRNQNIKYYRNNHQDYQDNASENSLNDTRIT
jgi:hypothetical protein